MGSGGKEKATMIHSRPDVVETNQKEGFRECGGKEGIWGIVVKPKLHMPMQQLRRNRCGKGAVKWKTGRS